MYGNKAQKAFNEALSVMENIYMPTTQSFFHNKINLLRIKMANSSSIEEKENILIEAEEMISLITEVFGNSRLLFDAYLNIDSMCSKLIDGYSNINDYKKYVNYIEKSITEKTKMTIAICKDEPSRCLAAALNLEWRIYEKAMQVLVYNRYDDALIEQLKNEGKYDEAIERFNKLIQDDPKNGRLYLDLSDCYVQKGNKEEAIAVLERCVKVDGKNPIVKSTLEKLKKYKARIKFLNGCLKSFEETAQEEFAKAMETHLNIEKFYISSMDFKKLDIATDELMKKIF